MQQKSSKKSIIILIVVIILGGLAYLYFSGTPDDSAISSLTPSGTAGGDVAAEITSATRILSLLNQINSIKIDTEFFKSKVYMSLVDRMVVVPEQNVGRQNPFVAVPGTFVVERASETSAPRR